MPTAASAALRAAVHDVLTANAALTALLGGPKVYDEPPRSIAFPYVTLGETRIADFSTGSEAGQESALEHQLTLHAWSRQGGQKEAHLNRPAAHEAVLSGSAHVAHVTLAALPTRAVADYEYQNIRRSLALAAVCFSFMRVTQTRAITISADKQHQ
jgi:hypothetical protein